MSAVLRWTFGGGAAILAAVAVGGMAERTDLPSVSLAAMAPPGDAVEAVDAEAVPEQSPMHAETILAAPLFAPDRQPDTVRGHAASSFSRRLTGVVITPAVRIAVFEGSPENKLVSIQVGEELDDWTVTAIRADGVDLSRRNGNIVVTFDPKQ